MGEWVYPQISSLATLIICHHALSEKELMFKELWPQKRRLEFCFILRDESVK